MRITQRYASAVNSSNLKSKPETTYSDTDVLGAHGIASRYVPLGVALQRLFVGGKPRECVSVMTAMVTARAAAYRHKIAPTTATEISQKVLAWYRFGTCTDCGGTCKEVKFEPKPHLSDEDCQACHGTGKRPFDNAFHPRHVELAQWIRNEVGREQGRAGREAMQAIAPSLEI